MMFRFNTLLLSLLCLSSTALQAETTISSSVTRVNLLELYTSEGCSSCPPADAWISELKSHPDLWQSLIPIAFHVDYWNYIGWTDRFSSPEYSLRQRRYARSKNLKTVYTPGFLLNGEEWRSFFGLRDAPDKSDDRVGKLELLINKDAVTASFKPVENNDTNDYKVNIAVLGFDLKTRVRSGENRNRTLYHDFTVLGFKTVPLYKQDGSYAVMTELPELVESVPRMAVTAWINKADDLAPVQATGGWLKNN